MNVSIFLGVLFFIVTFGAVFYFNSDTAKDRLYQFTPPYHYVVGETTSFINAFLFVFILSAAFFGLTSPIALGIEGLKYASLYTNASMPAFDLLFIIPQVIVAYSASLLGKGAVEDYDGKGNVFAYWKDALKWFAIATGALLGLIIARGYF